MIQKKCHGCSSKRKLTLREKCYKKLWYHAI